MVRLTSAFLLPLIWFGLILRAAYSGATIASMFLHILHKRLAGAVFLYWILVAGAASGLVAVNHVVSAGETVTFRQILVQLFRPFFLMLGEFEFLASVEDLETSHTWETLATCLLVGTLALVSTFVLLNLILALIVSDTGHLYQLSYKKKLFRNARQVKCRGC